MYPPHGFHIQCPIFPMLAVSGGFDRFFLNVSLPSITKLPPSGALFWGTPLIHLCGSSLGTRFRLHLLEIFHSRGRVVSRASVDGQGWIFDKMLSPPELEDWTVGFSMTFQGQVNLLPKDPQGWMDRLPKRHWGTMHRFLEGLWTEGQTLGGPLGQSTVTFWGPQFYLGFCWASSHSWFL